jgi:large subunit ribosomal protein L5
LPELKKIILNFGCKTADVKQLAASLLALELITGQRGIMTRTKHSNINFKIRKGNPTGCKVSLSKPQAYTFLSKMLIEIFPKLKNFYGFPINKRTKKNTFSYELKETFSFTELESHFYLFNGIPKLNITLVTTASTIDELLFLLKAFQLAFRG